MVGLPKLCFVGMLVRTCITDTVLEQDLFGLIICGVLAVRLIFSTVLTMVGAHTIVDITRTFLSVATALSSVIYEMTLNVLTVCDRLITRSHVNSCLRVH